MKPAYFIAALLGVVTLLSSPAHAADPPSGTLSVASPELSYEAGPFVISDPVPVGCADVPQACDDFALTVELPADYASTNPSAKFVIALSWDPQQADLDLALLDAAGAELATSGELAGTPERIEFPAGSGSAAYTVRISSFAGGGATATAVITLESGSSGPVEPPPPPRPPAPTDPRYQIYTPPAPLGETSGEPSVGYNVETKRAMYISGLQTLRATFPENLDPAQPEACEANWEDKSYIVTSIASLDPILFLDQATGRTFVSQLNSQPAGPLLVGANSLFAYSDDDGETWTPGQLDPPNGSLDHQTVGSGPYPDSVPLGNPSNGGSAVYYCSQAYVTGLCARSDTGGLTFNRPTAAYDLATSGCSSIHGHVKVAPDGTVLLPHNNCESEQAVSVSADAGTTWDVRFVTGSTLPPYFGMHPSVAAARDSNTLYYCYINANSEARIAVSRDKGLTWENDTNVGAGLGLKAVEFPEVIAGDPDRAACGFLGTTTAGNYQALDFPGVWYLYIAHTYDGGKTWTVVDADPGDPVQHAGGIWNQGGASPNRNLLDFNEITLDEKGYVLYSYADGCVGNCVPNGPNSFSEKANIARQRGGKPLYAEFDGPDVAPPKEACLAGRRDDTGSFLTWRRGDNGGSPITGYQVFRSTDPETGFVQIGATGGKRAYNDRSADPAVEKYYYRVVATTAQGESPNSNRVELPLGERPSTDGPCVLPGVLVVSAPTGDPTIPNEAFDIQSVSIAEPQNLDGKIVFTLKVASLASVPNGWRWAIRFKPPTAPPPFETGAASEDFYVAMVTSDGPEPSFSYGYTGVPDENAPGRFFVTLGDLDAESGFSEDGTITMILDKAAIGSPAPGDPIINVFGSVRATTPSALPGTGGTNQTIPDSTGGGAYTLRTADFCLPNTPPLAVLSADRMKGGAPLTVRFDASGSSDADTGVDSIASYSLNLGDGSEEITQSSPIFTHTYDKAATLPYPAKLVVTDSRGKGSSNVAQVLIEVPAGGSSSGGTPGPVPETPASGGRFGGLPSPALLLPMLLLAALRRSRH